MSNVNSRNLAFQSEVQQILAAASRRYSQIEIAARMGVSERTIGRWMNGEITPPPCVSDTLTQRLLPKPESTSCNPHFTFLDLFGGIGGTRRGFEAAGGRCVFTSEWDKFAQQTYAANYIEHPDHIFAGDITKVNPEEVPDHDVLVAGFPCQPFSLAGVTKKHSLGRRHGFEDETQGTLFFNLAQIINAKQPRAFLLENVKHLIAHDNGRTFEVIKSTLEQEFGYQLTWRVINGSHFVPQNRERIFIVGYLEETSFSFDNIKLPEATHTLASILHPEDGSEAPEEPYTQGMKAKVNAKYTLSPRLWKYLQDYAARHRAAGNGFGYGLVTPDARARTLSARYYKDGSEILVAQPGKRPRRLTPRECARLMGFPDNHVIPVSDTQAYRQFGNSVVVPVIESIAKEMVRHLP